MKDYLCSRALPAHNLRRQNAHKCKCYICFLVPRTTVKLLEIALTYICITLFASCNPSGPQAYFTVLLYHMKIQIPAWAHHIPAWQQLAGTE